MTVKTDKDNLWAAVTVKLGQEQKKKFVKKRKTLFERELEKFSSLTLKLKQQFVKRVRW